MFLSFSSFVVVVVALFSCVQFFATPWTAVHQASLSFTVCWSLLKLMSIELGMPSNHLILCGSLLLLPSIFPASGPFPMSWLFTSGGWSIGASATASVLPMSIQDWFPFRLTWSPCSPRDSQGSSPTPQFKSINSLALTFLYGPTLTSIYNYWKNHNFNYMDLCQRSDVSAF